MTEKSMIDSLPFRSCSRVRMLVRWYRIQHWINKIPRRMNEGEATARVVDSRFSGFPQAKDFKSKTEAVELLQLIWDDLDNWDGSRVNVRKARNR